MLTRQIRMTKIIFRLQAASCTTKNVFNRYFQFDSAALSRACYRTAAAAAVDGRQGWCDATALQSRSALQPDVQGLVYVRCPSTRLLTFKESIDLRRSISQRSILLLGPHTCMLALGIECPLAIGWSLRPVTAGWWSHMHAEVERQIKRLEYARSLMNCYPVPCLRIASIYGLCGIGWVPSCSNRMAYPGMCLPRPHTEPPMCPSSPVCHKSFCLRTLSGLSMH